MGNVGTGFSYGMEFAQLRSQVGRDSLSLLSSYPQLHVEIAAASVAEQAIQNCRDFYKQYFEALDRRLKPIPEDDYRLIVEQSDVEMRRLGAIHAQAITFLMYRMQHQDMLDGTKEEN